MDALVLTAEPIIVIMTFNNINLHIIFLPTTHLLLSLYSQFIMYTDIFCPLNDHIWKQRKRIYLVTYIFANLIFS